MNLLVNKSLKNIFLKSGLIILIPFFLGCDKADDFGVKYPLENGSEVKFIEIPLEQSMLLYDSIRTDNFSFAYTGNVTDPVTGKVTCSTVCQPIYKNGEVPNDTLTFDSVSFSLKYYGTIPNSKQIELDIDIYEMEDSLHNGVVYLGSYQINKKRKIASIQKTFFIPSEGKASDSVLSFILPKDDSFAKDFYEYVNKNSKNIASKTYNAISFESSSDGIVGFNLADSISGIRLHYTGKNSKKGFSSVFSLTQGGNYTFVNRDKSNADIKDIEKSKSFSLSSGSVYADPLSGIFPEIDLDSLKTFLQENKALAINKAEVSLEIEKENDRSSLNNLNLFFKNTNNFYSYPNSNTDFINKMVLNDNNYFSLSKISPAASIIDEKNEYLTFNITQFIQELSKGSKEKNELYFTNPFNKDIKIKLNKLILVNQNSLALGRTIIKPNGIKLKIYYTQLKK